MAGVHLAIELSTRTGSVAMAYGGRVVHRPLERARAHASDLIPSIERLAEDLKIDGHLGERLDAILVGTGPGSYTGLRVAIATALGLARGSQARLRGVPSFEALAYGVLTEGQEGILVNDARAGAFYFAHYRRQRDDVAPVTAPVAIPVTEVRERIAASEETALLFDSKLARMLELPSTDEARLFGTVAPHAVAMLELGTKRLQRLGPQAAHEIEPLYLRAFGRPRAR